MAYATREDLDNVFGCHNITVWADIENKGDAGHIESRINWALSLATSTVDDLLVEGPYVVPFTGTVPPQAVYATSIKAAMLLYNSRGMREADPDKNPLKPFVKEFDEWVAGILSNKIKLSTEKRRLNVRTYPEVLT